MGQRIEWNNATWEIVGVTLPGVVASIYVDRGLTSLAVVKADTWAAIVAIFFVSALAAAAAPAWRASRVDPIEALRTE